MANLVSHIQNIEGLQISQNKKSENDRSLTNQHSPEQSQHFADQCKLDKVC